MRAVRYGWLAVVAALGLVGSARAQNDAKQIMARPVGELIELLKNPTASAFEKAKACQQLATAGTKQAVPALVALLGDEKLSAYARTALENIPGTEVDEALREATKNLRGEALAGVLVSLGSRRDAHSVALLQKYLADKDVTVAVGAAAGLGQIGSMHAAAVLQKAFLDSPPKQEALFAAETDAMLKCADQLVRSQGEPATKMVARVLYITLRGLPLDAKTKHLNVAGVRGLFRIDNPDDKQTKDLLINQLQDPDPDFFNAGLTAARELSGPEITALLVAELAKLPEERQALLLRALSDRTDRAALTVFLGASKSPAKAVRAAAIYVLGKQGDASAVPTLLELATAGNDLSDDAKAALVMLSGTDIDVLIASRLAGADTKTKAVLFELIGARRIAAAEPAVREALGDKDESVRSAAVGALGQLISLEDFALLTSRLLASENVGDTKVLQAALQTAAMRMADIDGCAAKLSACLKEASAAKQDFLLTLLGRLGGSKALETVVQNASSQNAQVKDAATKVLGEWSTADAAPALLELAKNDSEEKFRVRALRGYIRIARQLQLTPDERIEMYQTAMKLAQRNEERQIALEILLRAPCTKSLELALAEMSQPAMKQAAGEIAVRVAHRMQGSDPQAIAAGMRKVVEAKISGNMANIAKQMLDQYEAKTK